MGPRHGPSGRCLTEKGQQDRIVGVSGYAARPTQVRYGKPRVLAFTSADIPAILALALDLVLTFSDLQASITAEPIQASLESNQ